MMQFDLITRRLCPPPTFALRLTASDTATATNTNTATSASDTSASDTSASDVQQQAQEDATLLIRSLTTQQVQRSRAIINANRATVLAHRHARLALQTSRQAESPPPTPTLTHSLTRPAASMTLPYNATQSCEESALLHRAPLLESHTHTHTHTHTRATVLQVKVRQPEARRKGVAAVTTATKKKKNSKSRGGGSKTIYVMRTPRGYVKQKAAAAATAATSSSSSLRCSSSAVDSLPDESEIPAKSLESLPSSSAPVAVISKGHHVSHVESDAVSTVSALARSGSPRSALAECPVLRIPVFLPSPRALTWVKLTHNFWAEDQSVLKYMPYFGDDDTTGFDMADFQQRPWEVEPALDGEVLEVAAFLLVDKYEVDSSTRSRLSLSPLLNVSSSTSVTFSSPTSNKPHSSFHRGLPSSKSKDRKRSGSFSGACGFAKFSNNAYNNSEINEGSEVDDYHSAAEEMVCDHLMMSTSQLRDAFGAGHHLKSSLDYIKVLLLYTLAEVDDCALDFQDKDTGGVDLNQILSMAAARTHGIMGESSSLSCEVLRGIVSTNADNIFQAGSSLYPVRFLVDLPPGMPLSSSCPPLLHPLLPLALYPLPSPLSLFLKPPPSSLSKDLKKDGSASLREQLVAQMYAEAAANYKHPVAESLLPYCEKTGLKFQCNSFNELSDNLRSFFCRRCYTYGCAVHASQQPFRFVRHDPVVPRLADQSLTSSGEEQRLIFKIPVSTQLAQLGSSTAKKGNGSKQRSRLAKLLLMEKQHVEENSGDSTNGSLPLALYRSLYSEPVSRVVSATGQSKTDAMQVKSAFSCDIDLATNSNSRNSSQSSRNSSPSTSRRKGVIRRKVPETTPASGEKRQREVLAVVKKDSGKSSESRKKCKMQPPEAFILLKLRNMMAAQYAGLTSTIGEEPDQPSKLSSIDQLRVARLLGTCLPCEVPARLQLASTLAERIEVNSDLPMKEVSDDEDYEAIRREMTHEYEPCHHEGPCSAENRCSCIRNNGKCEKYCACSAACKNRAAGCKCQQGCRTNACPCKAAGRECDPDLCLTCGASYHPELLVHSALNSSAGLAIGGCSNCAMTRGLEKRISLGRSEIHGFGCFIREDVKKDEYVTEYRGEILSQSEANRRGKCYDKSNSTFLFERNQDYVLDAMRKGNLIKFANHASVDRATMYPRIRIVNAEHRVALYAARNLKAGEELTFHYNSDQNTFKNSWAGADA